MQINDLVWVFLSGFWFGMVGGGWLVAITISTIMRIVSERDNPPPVTKEQHEELIKHIEKLEAEVKNEQAH